MLRQSSSRSHRSKKLRPSHTLQAFLLFAVSVWIVYQLTRSYGKQRVVAVETDGEPARRWLGRKGFVSLANGHASVHDIVGAGGGSDVGRVAAGSLDDHSSQAGDEEDQEADGDDGADSDADDVGGGLATDEEDDTDFLYQSDSNEDEPKTAQGQAQNGPNMTVVPSPVNATDTAQDGVAVLPVNATGRAADGSALKNNNSSSADLSLRERGTAGDVANNGSPGENKRLQTYKNGTADSVAEHGIP
ncbi:unnamed protein product [Urochloa humidicola]